VPRLQLVILTALIALAAAPPVAAADVRLDGGNWSMLFSGAGQTLEKEGSGLSFDETLTLSPDLASAHLRGNAAERPGGASVFAAADIDQSAGRSRVAMRRAFTVTESTPFSLRVRAQLRGERFSGEPQRFQLALSRSGETVVTLGSEGNGDWHRDRSNAGTLAPGSYELAVVSECRRRCLDTWRVNLSVGTAGAPAPLVALSGGPSGVVGESSALFDFVLVGEDPPEGRFECSLDGGDFDVCTSPHGLSELADGEHVFAVRFAPDEGEPGVPSERRWTVDTTSPAVVFDAAPEGADNPPNGEIAFHSSEPDGATFLCSLDAGPLFECASPHAMTNLAAGPHSFTVEATDRAGNQSVPNSVTWSVRTPEFPAQPPCGPDAGEVTFGPIRVVARATDACFTVETIDGREVKVSRGQIMLNGIRLTPEPGTRIVVDARGTDGGVRTTGPVTVGFGGFAVPIPFGIDLDRLAAGSDGLTRALAFGASKIPLGGGTAFPTIATEFTKADGGSAKLTFKVALPEKVFSRLPGTPEKVTVELTPTLSNDRGVTVAGKVTLGTVFVFGRKLTNVELFFDQAGGRIGGSGTLELGPEPPTVAGVAPPALAREKLTISFVLDVVDTACGLETLSMVTSDKNKHIGDGIYLQRVGGSFECVTENGLPVETLTALGGLSFGPRIDNGPTEGLFKEIASIDGTAKIVIPVGTSRRFTFELEGTGAIVDIPVTKMGLKYTPPFHIEQTASLDLTLSGVGVKLEQRHFYIGANGYSIDLVGELDLFGIRKGAEGIISTRGFAFCFGPPGKQVGYGRTWRSGLDPMSDTCDVSKLAVAPVAQGSQVGSSFTVARGASLKVVSIKGAGAPPKVRVDGPGGRRIESPTGPGGLDTTSVTLVQDDVADATFLVLRDPPPGRWTIAPLPGSVPIGTVKTADGLPPLRLSARVTGSGAERTLSWTANPLGGQQIEFAERGRAGTGRVLATTRRRTGRLKFAPDLTLGRSRTIEAIVSNGGIPRARRTVARFRVASPQRVRRVAAVRMRGNRISWRAQRAAASYELAVIRPDGTTTSHSTRRPGLTLRGIPRTGTLRIEVLAVDLLGRPGQITRTRLKLNKQPPRQ